MEDKNKKFCEAVENYKAEALKTAPGGFNNAIRKDRDAILDAATDAGLSINAVKVYYAELFPTLSTYSGVPAVLENKFRRDVFDDAVSIVLTGKAPYRRPIVY